MLQTAMLPTLGAAGEQTFTDAQLLALIGRGENWEVSEIYNRYARLVCSISLRTLSDRASADEIVQGVFAKVWLHARNYRVERGKFSTWLIKISRHECIDELRRRCVRPVTQPGDEELLDRLAGNDLPWPGTQAAFEQACVREALHRVQHSSELSLNWLFGKG